MSRKDEQDFFKSLNLTDIVRVIECMVKVDTSRDGNLLTVSNLNKRLSFTCTDDTLSREIVASSSVENYI